MRDTKWIELSICLRDDSKRMTLVLAEQVALQHKDTWYQGGVREVLLSMLSPKLPKASGGATAATRVRLGHTERVSGLLAKRSCCTRGCEQV